MKQIPVFKAEQEAGLAKLIQSNASIAYLSKLEDTNLSQEAVAKLLKTNASEIDERQFDLFYLNTILVTTGWNKNDDVFDRSETWAARYTPIHKQFNLEHDQSKIIGHMTSAKAVDDSYSLIPENTPIDSLPAKFHILTGAVIYRALSDEDARKNIETIIEEIGKGEWFVSMECLFRGFDYAITSSTGEQRILPRTEETAFLTKHLRAYNGSGKYENFTLGRCLKNFTFSGKGLVRKPANPESVVILSDSVATFRPSFTNLEYIKVSNNSHKITESVSMANENTDTKDKDLVNKLTEATDRIKELEKQVKDHESSATTAKITSLTESLDKATKTAEANDKKVKDLESKVAELTPAAEKVPTLEKELKDLKAEKTVVARTSILVDKGLPKNEADAFAALLADKSDAEFDAFAKLMEKKVTKAAKTEDEDKEDKKAKADKNKKTAKSKLEDALEDMEDEEDVSLSSNNDEEEDGDVHNLRESMAAVFASVLNGDDEE